MANVLVVRDSRTGTTSAMKLLHRIADEEAVHNRFRREFRALSRLFHPNVLRVEEWGIHDARPWFTMELVDGEDLRTVMVRWQALPAATRFERIRDVLVQTTRALSYVHDRGLVHRDVSPGNILLRNDGTVKLADFGLVTDRSAELTTAGEILGTVAHISPEQLRGDRVDGRADLYALGTVLYQMLTGRKPFNAHTVQGWVEHHLHEVPRPPHELDPLVPELLDRVCTRLLRKQPEDRFASAIHLLQVLGDTERIEDVDEWPPRLVGRTRTQAWIRETIEDVSQGRRGGALTMTGTSGSGKTRLLDLAERTAQRHGVKVARGRCRPLDRPFGPFVAIFDALRTPQAPDVLVRALGGGSDAPAERYPVIAAFRELVEAVAPCVILVDQMHFADASTRELLDYVVRNTLELSEIAVTFVLAREPEAELLHDDPAAATSVMEEHVLGPLAPSEVEELVLAVLDDTDASRTLARRLHADTDGTPAYVADMLRALVDEGIVRREGDRWVLAVHHQDMGHSSLPLPTKLRKVLSDRLAPLSEEAWELGRTLAIARGPMSIEMITGSVRLDEDRLFDALDALVDAGIVSEHRRGDTEYAELSHARFRDVLLEGQSAQAMRTRHRRVGEMLEDQYRYDRTHVVEALAWHFERADVPTKAYLYLSETASKHLQRGLFEDALGFVERALRIEPEARAHLPLAEADRQRAELLLARARALYHLGQWDDALTFGRTAIALATKVRDPHQLARIKTRVGYILRNQAHVDEAEDMLQQAVAHAEEAGDRTLLPRALYHLGAVAWAKGNLELAAGYWHRTLDLSRELGLRRAEGMAHNGLGIMQICRGEMVEARRLLEVAADIFREVGMMGYLAIVHVNLIEIYLATGMLRRGLVLVDSTIAQAREVGHPHGVSMGLVWRARLLLAIGRPGEAQTTSEEAMRIAAELGTVEEQVAGLTTLVEAMIIQHHGALALAHVEVLMDLMRDVDHEGAISQVRALLAQVLVERGDTDSAHALMDVPTITPPFPLVQVRTDLDLGRAHSLLHRRDEAIDSAQRALVTSSRHGFRFYELVAHHRLAAIVLDDAERQMHVNKAVNLARSLAASLPRAEAESFLARRWGGVAPRA